MHFRRAIENLLPNLTSSFAISDETECELIRRVDVMTVSEKCSLIHGGEAVMEVRQKQQRFYLSKSDIPVAPGLAREGGKRMSLDNMVVNICILSAEVLERLVDQSSEFGSLGDQRSEYLFENASPMLELRDVFEVRVAGERKPTWVLAAGGVGCGKSVCFICKAPYNWACGKLWPQFALFFCVTLQDETVWKAQSLAELLKLDHLGLDKQQKEEVMAFIERYPERVLLVCDGLDEGNATKGSFLWSLLERSCAATPDSLHVLVTTRPCQASGELSKTACFDRRVELTGFTRAHVSAFVENYLEAVDAAALLAELRYQPSVAALMCTPFFSLLVCEQFKEHRALPTRKTQIFKNVLLRLLQRHVGAGTRKEAHKTRCNSVDGATEDLKEVIHSLGKFAYNGLLCQQLCFSDTDLAKAEVHPSALEVGLLTEVESGATWKPDRYMFCHVTIQEFLAALYVSCSPEVHTPARMKDLIANIDLSNRYMRMFVVFTAGLVTAEIGEALLGSVQSQLTWDARQDWSPVTLLYQCYHESQMGVAASSSPTVSFALQEDGLSLPAFYSLSASEWIAMASVVRSHPEAIEKVRLLHSIAVSGELLRVFLDALLACYSIQVLEFSFPSADRDLHAQLAEILTHNSPVMVEPFNEVSGGLHELSLHCSWMPSGSPVLASLYQCSQLTTLALNNLPPSAAADSAFVTGLCTVLPFLANLLRLHLWCVHLSDGGFQEVLELRTNSRKLRVLRIRLGAGLTTSSLLRMSALLQSLACLEEINIRGNNFSGSAEVEAFLEEARKHPTLERCFL